MDRYDLIVLSGGSGGLVAGVGAAQLGARLLLIERRARGGLVHVYPTLMQVTQKAALDAVLASLARYRPVLSRYFAWRR